MQHRPTVQAGCERYLIFCIASFHATVEDSICASGEFSVGDGTRALGRQDQCTASPNGPHCVVRGSIRRPTEPDDIPNPHHLLSFTLFSFTSFSSFSFLRFLSFSPLFIINQPVCNGLHVRYPPRRLCRRCVSRGNGTGIPTTYLFQRPCCARPASTCFFSENQNHG